LADQHDGPDSDHSEHATDPLALVRGQGGGLGRRRISTTHFVLQGWGCLRLLRRCSAGIKLPVHVRRAALEARQHLCALGARGLAAAAELLALPAHQQEVGAEAFGTTLAVGIASIAVLGVPSRQPVLKACVREAIREPIAVRAGLPGFGRDYLLAGVQRRVAGEGLVAVATRRVLGIDGGAELRQEVQPVVRLQGRQEVFQLVGRRRAGARGGHGSAAEHDDLLPQREDFGLHLPHAIIVGRRAGHPLTAYSNRMPTHTKRFVGAKRCTHRQGRKKGSRR
jgi:hypothetical protein